MSRDVMDRLAGARPAHLSPDLPPDPATRSREIGLACAGPRGARHPRRAARGRRVRPLAMGGIAAAAAAGTAVVLVMTAAGPGPVSPRLRLTAALTYLGAPEGSGDAAAVLLRLAAKAAAQPSPALGPVEYVKTAIWGADDGKAHYGLTYRPHSLLIDQNWSGPGGDAHTVRTPDGRLPGGGLVPTSYDRVNPKHNRGWARADPAMIPASPAALRRYLLRAAGPLPSTSGTGKVVEGTKVSKTRVPTAFSPDPPPPPGVLIYGQALVLMNSEPLRPAVRAELLRLMAGTVQQARWPYRFFDLGTVADRAGHRGVAIAEQVSAVTTVRGGPGGKPIARLVPTLQPSLDVLIFDPKTGALLGWESGSCRRPVGNLAGANRLCYADGYMQYLQIKAVPAIPPLSALRH